MEKGFFAGIIKDIEMRSSWIGVAVSPMMSVLVREEERQTRRGRFPNQTHRRLCNDGDDKADEATGQGKPGAPCAGRGKKDPLLELPGEVRPCHNLSLDFCSLAQ